MGSSKSLWSWICWIYSSHPWTFSPKQAMLRYQSSHAMIFWNNCRQLGDSQQLRSLRSVGNEDIFSQFPNSIHPTRKHQIPGMFRSKNPIPWRAPWHAMISPEKMMGFCPDLQLRFLLVMSPWKKPISAQERVRRPAGQSYGCLRACSFLRQKSEKAGLELGFRGELGF